MRSMPGRPRTIREAQTSAYLYCPPRNPWPAGVSTVQHTGSPAAKITGWLFPLESGLPGDRGLKASTLTSRMDLYTSMSTGWPTSL